MNKPNQASVPAQGAQHTAGPWKVVAHPLLGAKHPFHETRYIMTQDAQISVRDPAPDVRNANDWDTAWELESGVIICELRDSMYRRGNARLIAAAPEMLRRLQSINILTLNQSVVSPGALRELLRDIGGMARDAIAVAAPESREVGR